jgi:hypothetical protein
LAFSLVWGVANGQGNQTGLPATPPNNEPPATTAPSNQQMGQQTAKTPTPTLSIPPEGAPVNIYFNANNEGSEGGDKSQDTYTFLQVVIAGVEGQAGSAGECLFAVRNTYRFQVPVVGEKCVCGFFSFHGFGGGKGGVVEVGHDFRFCWVD